MTYRQNRRRIQRKRDPRADLLAQQQQQTARTLVALTAAAQEVVADSGGSITIPEIDRALIDLKDLRVIVGIF